MNSSFFKILFCIPIKPKPNILIPPKKSIKTMEQQTLEMQRLNYKSENDDEMVNLLKKIEKSVLIEKSDNWLNI